MLPLSVDPQALSRRDVFAAVLRDARWRPHNVPFAVSAELRALTLWLGLIALAGVLVALAHVWVRLRVVDVGYRLSATQQLVERLRQEGQELAVEAAAADTPGRLEQEVQLRLGLRRPQPWQDTVLP
jgi:hypothetical protein